MANNRSKIRINKVYTKHGDKGQTMLTDGKKVSKDDIRVEAYGTIDELQAFIGACGYYMDKENIDDNLSKIIYRIQNELFDLGSLISRNDFEKNKNIPKITMKNVTMLEEEIDLYNNDLPELTSFVLPGGDPLNIYFHIARTVCRRAERRCVELSKRSKVDGNIIIYLNRLSDMLFVLSRWILLKKKINEKLWEPNI